MLNVKVDLSGLNRLRKRLMDNPRAMSEIRQAWSIIYRAFVRLRFVRLSRGGGEWPNLAPSTVRRRRRRSSVILRDTGKLLASFQPTLGNAGSMVGTDKPMGLSMNYGGSPLARIAQFHHDGDPAQNRPPRELLVPPDDATIKKMGQVARDILVKAANE